MDFGDHVDVMPFAGEEMQVRFYADYNEDANGTWFYLDDVECNLCTEWPVPDDREGTASIGGLTVVGSSPTSGVRVRAYSQGGNIYRTVSIHDSSYHFYNIPPGHYFIYAEAWVDGILNVGSAEVTVVSDERNYGVTLLLR